MSKSQIGIAGFLIGLFGFSMILILLISTWNLYVVRFSQTSAIKEMQLKASQVTDILVQTPGYPSDWESDPSKLVLVGLASSDRNLSVQKVQALSNLSYYTVKDSLNIFYYDLFIDISSLDGTNITTFGEPFKGNMSIQSTRFVMYNGEKTIVKAILWQ